MPQFAFDPSLEAVEQLQNLPGEWSVIFDPGEPDYEINLILTIPRGYAAHILRLIDHLRLVDQDPPVSLQSGDESLRSFLLHSLPTS